MATCFEHAPYVRSVLHGDRTVLLDLRRGRYHSLDEVGTRIWTLLDGGADGPTIAARLGEEFDAPAEQIRRDVDGFLRRLADDLRVIVPVVPMRTPVEPSGIHCALALVVTTIALRTIGFRRSLAVAGWLGRRVPAAAEPSPAILANVARRIATAAAFVPARALCLEQALALYVCLRRSGVPAELRIGAQPYPFTAHAWVEYRDALVGTSYDQVCKFVPFDRLVEAV